ncbi:MAG: hypothetical protein CMF72_24645 [Mameliella sp.]|nr:hypothetical protein [Mameliella sp.]
MTDNLPALPSDEPSREVARADTDSWIAVVADVSRFASMIAGTEFVPRSLRDNPAATAAAILYGREVGLPPMTALTQTHVIEGRPSLSSEAMRAQVIAAGHDIEVLESTGGMCRMRGRRRGSQTWTPEVAWSIDMARAAGLLSKNNWKNHPRRMLQARASGELCQLYFPDVVLGFAVTEELLDEGGQEQASPDAPAQTTVKRTRKTAKKAAAALPAGKPAERPDVSGPPLPGEDGYDGDQAPAPDAAPTEQTSAEVPGDGSSPSRGEETGEDSEGSPADVVDAETVDAPTDTETADEPLPDPAPQERPPAGPSSRAQHRMIFAALEGLGVEEGNGDSRKAIATVIVGREIESFTSLSKADASHVIDTLARCKTEADLWALLDEIEASR